MPIGAAARGCAVFQQQERHVIVGITAGVLVHGSYQGVQYLVAVSCAKHRCDHVLGEEVSVLITAFGQPVSVEQQPGHRATSSR